MIPRIVAEVHDDLATHPGWRSAKQMIESKWSWKDWKKDIKELIESCSQCQMYKDPHLRKPPIRMQTTPTKPFQGI